MSAYVNQISEWINSTWPHSEHELINHAIPAVRSKSYIAVLSMALQHLPISAVLVSVQINSGYIAPCVTELVPNDTDLVLLEFTFNDSERGSMALNDTTLQAALPPVAILASICSQITETLAWHVCRRGLERLLRKLMRMPAQPGLIYLHYWAGRHLKDNFTHTAEDAINTMLKVLTANPIAAGMRQAVCSALSCAAVRLQVLRAPGPLDAGLSARAAAPRGSGWPGRKDVPAADNHGRHPSLLHRVQARHSHLCQHLPLCRLPLSPNCRSRSQWRTASNNDSQDGSSSSQTRL